VSDRDYFIWHINLSHINRYLIADLAKYFGIGSFILIVIQVLPLEQSTLGLVSTTGYMVLLVWGFILVLKLFISFNGHSVRFTLDGTGASALNEEGKLGLKYIAKQISSTGWGKGKACESSIQWAHITKILVDDRKKIITLKEKMETFNLFCSAENFNDVLCIVRDHVNL
jgi:hypothetical protein